MQQIQCRTFQQMSFNELQELTIGVYQLKRAHAYGPEYMSFDGTY